MGKWEEHFATRMNALHHASSGNFDDLVQAEIMPAFEDLKSFVTSGGFTAVAMKGCDKIRPFRFSLSKDMFIDLFFRRRGPAEVTASFQLHHPFTERREAVVLETVPLSSVTEGWARQQFQVCLDEFLTEVEVLIGTGVPVVLDPLAKAPDEPTGADGPAPTSKREAPAAPKKPVPAPPTAQQQESSAQANPQASTPPDAAPTGSEAAKTPPATQQDTGSQQSAA
ncbi:MAG: hypothetical protein IIA64_00355 [Planctomycetes bacterium]|nr:hypothetical protein [Planctomycetota bacterium]